jgi:non-ribosomal peptide synthetase component E (peptide arylation enzyme)
MPTIGGSVIQNARRVPDREALVSSDRRWTWAELDDKVARAAGRLAAAGLGRGPVRRPIDQHPRDGEPRHRRPYAKFRP